MKACAPLLTGQQPRELKQDNFRANTNHFLSRHHTLISFFLRVPESLHNKSNGLGGEEKPAIFYLDLLCSLSLYLSIQLALSLSLSDIQLLVSQLRSDYRVGQIRVIYIHISIYTYIFSLPTPSPPGSYCTTQAILHALFANGSTIYYPCMQDLSKDPGPKMKQ